MTREAYDVLESYMLSCIEDTAHDREHITRVLYAALDIAAHEENVDYDLLIASCLLHDIGRPAQAADPKVDHAVAGANMARDFLIAHGYSQDFADAAAECIRAHRFRGKASCGRIEAKILYDADKLDAIGALGVARTLIYKGQVAEPLYTRDDAGGIQDGSGDAPPSFLHEYRFKLQTLPGRLHTARAREIAAQRRDAAEQFYRALLTDVQTLDERGASLLRELIPEPCASGPSGQGCR